ncbi:MAG: type IX secretion system membrane protein PorP/SprF, partial [Paludibacter sp.]
SDLGFEAANQNFRAGLVIQNMFSVFSASKSNLVYRNDNANFLYLLYRSNNDNLFNFGYGLTGIQNVNIYQFEGSLTTFIKYYNDSDPLQLGISLSTANQFGAHAGVYIDKNIKLLYSYDVNFGRLGNYSKGTHELLLRVRLNRSRQWGYRNYFENNSVNYY